MTSILSSPVRIQLSRLLAVLAPFALLAPLQARSQEQVIWTPVTDEQAEDAQILVPALDGGAGSGSSFQNEATRKLQPIVWEVLPEAEPKSIEETPSTATVVWESLPGRQQPSSDGAIAPPTAIVWEVIPDTAPALSPDPTGSIAGIEEANPEDSPPPDVIAQEQAMPSPELPAPKPPQLQALNRSIAFGDGLVGPDISLRIPNGFRWSQRWFGDVTILGYDYQEGRNPGDPFIPAGDSGNLDGWGIIHLNVLQTDNWSVALNTSFRSLQSNPDIPGGSTGFDDGLSSGFRIARAIGDTGGIAFGGEQVIQWDDNTDTGRNLYLMATNGWWLGRNGTDYPLFIANGGFGTGRFASLTDDDEPFNFTCTPVESNRKVAKIDENLCWGPIGSVSLVMNEWWGIFVDYAISRATFGVSTNLTGGIPLRVTGGVHFVEGAEIVPFNELRWIVEASLGF